MKKKCYMIILILLSLIMFACKKDDGVVNVEKNKNLTVHSEEVISETIIYREPLLNPVFINHTFKV